MIIEYAIAAVALGIGTYGYLVGAEKIRFPWKEGIADATKSRLQRFWLRGGLVLIAIGVLRVAVTILDQFPTE